MQLDTPTRPELPDVHVRPPLVHVPPVWEYKHVVRQASEPPLDEATLNTLGEEGWELAGVVTHSGTTHFYFKRLAE